MHKSIIRFIFSGMLILTFFSSQVYAWEVGVAPATRKILPDTSVPQEQEALLQAATNEWEAFQIVLRDSIALEGVDVTLSDLKGPDDATLPASGARLYLQWYLDITNESPSSVTYHERGTGLYPDPLIPFKDPYAESDTALAAPFELTGEQTTAVFVDYYVPSGTLAGDYHGQATVSAQGKEDIVIPVSLTVWEFELPAFKSMGTAYGFSTNLVRNFHGGPGEEAEEGFEQIFNRYYQALYEHRMDPTHIKGPVSFEFSDEDELLPVDWTDYDAYVAPFLDGSLFEDGIGVSRFNVGHFRPGSGTGAMTDDQYAKAAKAFAEHLVEKGWWDRAYIYATDEPWLNGGAETYQKIMNDAGLLFKYTDLWADKILITGPYQEELKEVVGIWCPVTPMYENWFFTGGDMAGREEYEALMELGVKLWFYVCNANHPPYAGYDIDTAIGYEPRIVKWGTWFERATGFLFWRVNYWVDNDPWNVFLNIPQFGEIGSRNGDGMLLYPGDHNGKVVGKGSPEHVAIDGPIISYRMKQIRDGFEDWELFIMASELGAEAFTRQQVSRAYTRFGDFLYEYCEGEGFYCPDDQPWTLDEYLLYEVREKVAAKILYLLHPDKYPDPEVAVEDGDLDEEGDVETEEETSTDGDLNEAGDGDVDEDLEPEPSEEEPVIECLEDKDCGNDFCNPEGMCVECLTNEDCRFGCDGSYACENGRCSVLCISSPPPDDGCRTAGTPREIPYILAMILLTILILRRRGGFDSKL